LDVGVAGEVGGQQVGIVCADVLLPAVGVVVAVVDVRVYGLKWAFIRVIVFDCASADTLQFQSISLAIRITLK
jgi:hypothetical protein